MDHEPGPVRGDRTVAFRREVALVETVLTALAPVVVTLMLGFVAASHHDFAAKDAAVLNRMVLLYAVPVALFVGTAGTPRSELVQDVAFAVAMCVAIVGMYALVFLFFRLAALFTGRERIGGTRCVCAGRAIHGTGCSRRPIWQSERRFHRDCRYRH
jgi:hypothetical protein